MVGKPATEMIAAFDPRLDILPESQRALWPELDAVPSDFILYGGTALALQLGHRVSEDFDFFSSAGFEPDRLHSRLPFFRDLDKALSDRWVHYKRDNLEGYIERSGGTVKVAFFGASIPSIALGIRAARPDRGCGWRLWWIWPA